MRIESIELDQVGPFSSRVAAGPFGPGLNILAAANESGKSTLVKAVTRALFDKHTCRDSEIRLLQPAGTDLSPKIAVTFQVSQARLKVEKVFLNSPRCLLSEWRQGGWQLIAEGDSADIQLQQLLRSKTPGRGATHAAHWGLISYLWARQGEPALWPKWEGESGNLVQTRLAKVELDAAMERIQELLTKEYTEVFTPTTGQARAAGPLRKAEEELAALDAQLAEIRSKRVQLEKLQTEFLAIGSRVETLERESSDKQKQADEIRQQAVEAEGLTNQLKVRQGELDAAQAALHRVSEDAVSLQTCRQTLAENESQVARAAEQREALEAESKALTAQQSVAEAETENVQQQLDGLLGELDRVRALRKFHQARRDFEQLDALAQKIVKLQREHLQFQAERARLPDITSARLKRLTELDRSVREKRIQIEARGIHIEFQPEADAQLTIDDGALPAKLTIRAHEKETRAFPQSIRLHLDGWGTISVRSGAAEIKELMDALQADGAQLERALKEWNVSSVEKARQAFDEIAILDNQIRSSFSNIKTWLGEWEAVEHLQAQVKSLQVRAETGEGQFTGEERASTLAEIEAREQKLEIQVRHEEQGLKSIRAEAKRLRTRLTDILDAVRKAERCIAEGKGKQLGMESQIRLLQERYEEGLDAAKRKAQKQFFEAETRCDALKAKLPPDHERLPERNRRSSAAAQQVAAELLEQRQAFARLEGTLKTLGSEGLFSKETFLLEKRETVAQNMDRLRSRAWAARLVRDLIDFRKQAATRLVLAPLEARLGTVFSEISGNYARHVFLDESLQIRGVGRNADELIPFESLSQGAKEQLLLALRLAIAQELAAEEPQMLILDDVLVNTDPARQQRILDILTDAAATVQILILTCHPDRYRGAGQAISIVPAAAAS